MPDTQKRKYNKMIPVYVDEKIYNEFKDAVKFFYQTKSGALRKFIVEYIRHYKYEKQKLKSEQEWEQ